MIGRDTYLRFCDEALVAMRDIVVELGDDLANRRPDLPGANSPFAILTHCLGVVGRWASTVNLGQVVPRDREAEFRATGRVADLAERTDAMRTWFAAWVAAADPDAPPANAPQGDDDFFVATQGGVLLHVYEELAQHRGQLEITRDVLRHGLRDLPRERPPLVVVMGVSGSGKTTVGRALAERLGVPFEDADDLHPEANVAKMSAGIPLDDADRGPWLETVGRWLAAHRDTGAVVSCSALRRAYRDVLADAAPSAVFLHLDGPRDVVAARVGSRPDHFMPASLVDSQFATLEPLQPDEHGHVLDLSRLLEDLVDESVALLGRDGERSVGVN
jgi:gluconokinase